MKNFSMKKIFTIVMVLSVFLSFGQRPQVSSSHDLQKSTFGVVMVPKTEVDTLIPGNWANATAASVYWFSEAIGYVFGTNTYNDKAYGQQFSVEEPMELTGGIFWIAYADGTVGNIIFTVWDFLDGAPGAVLVSKAIPITEVVGSTSLANAITVYFDESIVVEGDFVVGVDFNELEAYVPTTKRLGHVSSQIGMGGNLGLVWVKEEDDGWFDVMGYTNPIDVDLGIFPFVVPTGSDGFTVTFNVDMTDAEGFDPAEDKVYVTGNFTGWAQPGTGGSAQMTLVDNPAKNGDIVFSEDFGGGDVPEGWENVIVTGPAGWAWTNVGGAYGGQLESTTAANGYMILDSDALGTGADEEANLFTPAIDLSNVSGEILFSIEHVARTYGFAECRIFISTDDFATHEMLYEWEGAAQNEWNTSSGAAPDPTLIVESFDISDYAGEANVKIKFNWIGAYDYWWLLDDVVITGTIAGTPEELIYTATVENVPAGDLIYKYFSDAFGEGWDGGEWAGDPNRSVMIDGDIVIHNVWGDLVVSLNEIELDLVTRVYPNPVRNTLYIQSGQQIDYLRLFDMAGRLIYQAEVMDFETTIDANQLRGGLYILQMISGQQVKTHKIQVVK
jgi:hypothetical protein